MKHSKQRDALLSLIRSTDSHPSADWLYENLRHEFPNISLGTVYRNLGVLVENGDIIRIQTNFAKEHFDGKLDNHHHFICRECGAISDVSIDGVEEIGKQAAEKLSASVDETSLVFYGLCGDCRQKEKMCKPVHS